MANINTNYIGNIFTQSFTGLVRIPALLASATAITIAGELAIRTLSGIISQFGFSPKKDSYISKACNLVKTNIRPFGGTEIESEDTRIEGKLVKKYKVVFDYKTIDLIKKLFITAAIGIFASELVRVLAGNAPPVYNHVLTVLGPFRLNTESYINGVKSVYGIARTTVGY